MSRIAALDRRGTNSVKWDGTPEGIIPMWVADMDFACAEPIDEAIRERASHPLYGYSNDGNEDVPALLGFVERRHGLKADKSWVLKSPGVVTSLYTAVQALTQPGDGVTVMTPVYGPFYSAIRDTGRRVAENRLLEENGQYAIDFDGLDKCLSDSRLLLLCSPHNPVGRVFTRSELAHIVEMTRAHNVTIVSDEIHYDFLRSGVVHIPILDADAGAVLLCAPSKTFNIAGLQHSHILAPDEDIRKRLSEHIHKAHIAAGNVFARAASKAAFSQCDAWLDSMNAVITENLAYVRDHILSPVRANYPDSTYLSWLDFRALGKDNDTVYKALIEAGVRLSDGRDFGAAGEGFMRLNAACAIETLREGVERVNTAIEGLLGK